MGSLAREEERRGRRRRQAQGQEEAEEGQPLSVKGLLPGFSKGVNDALVPAATLVHFKASGLLGFALTLAGLVLAHKPHGGPASALHYAGVLTLIAAASVAGAVIFPKKSSRKGGLIFWGDIAGHASSSDYLQSLQRLESAEDAEREYAFTNHRFAQVLDSKYGLIRWAVCLLLAGAALAGAGIVAEPG
jgi:hypothetical protein